MLSYEQYLKREYFLTRNHSYSQGVPLARCPTAIFPTMLTPCSRLSYRVMVMLRSTAIRSESGGCVLNNPENIWPAREWRNDKQRSSGRGNVHGNSLIVSAQFFERADQAVGMSDHSRARCVSRKLALPGNSQLDQQGGNRRHHQHYERCQTSAISIIPRTAKPAKNHGPAAHATRSR